MEIIEAPWTEEQIEALNAFQQAGFVHPFTCGNEDKSGHQDGVGVLTATRSGWICPFCDYRQDWAHAFMADPEPLQAIKRRIEELRK